MSDRVETSVTTKVCDTCQKRSRSRKRCIQCRYGRSGCDTRSSCWRSSAGSMSSAACRLAARCASEHAPTITVATSSRPNNHASATRAGVELSAPATTRSSSTIGSTLRGSIGEKLRFVPPFLPAHRSVRCIFRSGSHPTAGSDHQRHIMLSRDGGNFVLDVAHRQ